MKKRMIALLMLSVLMFSVLAGCGDPEYITEEKAKEIAIGDTNYTAATVQYLTVELTEEEESAFYTVSFTADGMQYVYKLDATSGEILEYPMFF